MVCSRGVEEGERARGAVNRRGLSHPSSVDILEVKDNISNTNIRKYEIFCFPWNNSNGKLKVHKIESTKNVLY